MNCEDEMRKLMILACLLVTTPAFAEFYKCTSDGKITYSDKPCTGGGGKIDLKVAPVSTPSAQSIEEANFVKTEKDRAQANEKLRKDSDNRIKSKILTEDIERAENQMKQLNSKMEKELTALREKKRSANNNLAGATYEQSISTEMNAVSISYSNKIALQKAEIDRLQKEKDALGKP